MGNISKRNLPKKLISMLLTVMILTIFCSTSFAASYWTAPDGTDYRIRTDSNGDQYVRLESDTTYHYDTASDVLLYGFFKDVVLEAVGDLASSYFGDVISEVVSSFVDEIWPEIEVGDKHKFYYCIDYYIEDDYFNYYSYEKWYREDSDGDWELLDTAYYEEDWYSGSGYRGFKDRFDW